MSRLDKRKPASSPDWTTKGGTQFPPVDDNYRIKTKRNNPQALKKKKKDDALDVSRRRFRAGKKRNSLAPKRHRSEFPWTGNPPGKKTPKLKRKKNCPPRPAKNLAKERAGRDTIEGKRNLETLGAKRPQGTPSKIQRNGRRKGRGTRQGEPREECPQSLQVEKLRTSRMVMKRSRPTDREKEQAMKKRSSARSLGRKRNLFEGALPTRVSTGVSGGGVSCIVQDSEGKEDHSSRTERKGFKDEGGHQRPSPGPILEKPPPIFTRREVGLERKGRKKNLLILQKKKPRKNFLKSARLGSEGSTK